MRSSRTLLALVAVSIFFAACGKKESSAPKATTVTPSPIAAVPPPAPGPTPGPTPSPGTGSAPLSYEISVYGGSTVVSTSPITTDNVLKVRYEVGPAGNQVFDATDVRVEISVNGSTKIPRYTEDPNCPSGGCEYGRPSDGPSTILDFSGNLTQGAPVVIKVSQARYNWYCYSGLYPGQIPYYNPYEGCNYRLVLDPFNNGSQSSPGHYWKGRLIVATNATNMTLFESDNP